jgi:hypothetical protein
MLHINFQLIGDYYSAFSDAMRLGTPGLFTVLIASSTSKIFSIGFRARPIWHSQQEA